MLQPKNKRPDTPLAPTQEPKVTYKNLSLARTAANNSAGRPTATPATAKDSLNYKRGFKAGLEGKKTSAMRKKYEGTDEYFEKGTWEGKNAKNK